MRSASSPRRQIPRLCVLHRRSVYAAPPAGSAIALDGRRIEERPWRKPRQRIPRLAEHAHQPVVDQQLRHPRASSRVSELRDARRHGATDHGPRARRLELACWFRRRRRTTAPGAAQLAPDPRPQAPARPPARRHLPRSPGTSGTGRWRSGHRRVPSMSGTAACTPSTLRTRDNADAGMLMVCSTESTAGLHDPYLGRSVLGDQRKAAGHETAEIGGGEGDQE